MGKENKTRYAILGVLNIHPASGYDIKKFCDQSINHFWNENYGHIYPVLRQMEQDGWVTKTVEKVSGRPSRNVYSVTEAGRNALLEWLHLPPELPQARYEFLLKIFFSDQIPAESTLVWMYESRVFCEGLLQEYEKIEAQIRSIMKEKGREGDRFYFRLATVRFGIHNMRATVDWCTEVIEYLEKNFVKEKKK